MFIYQPTLDILQLKENKDIDYNVGWKSKRVCTYKPIYCFLETKVVNTYIVCDLDT